MLQLLLDSHIAPAVARAAIRFCRGIQIIPLREWQGGHWLNAPDDLLLREARQQDFSLVTYDLRTIPALLRSWADQSLDHGGVIFVDDRTLAQNDIGGLARALCRLWRTEKNADWTNRALFLRRVRRN